MATSVATPKLTTTFLYKRLPFSLPVSSHFLSLPKTLTSPSLSYVQSHHLRQHHPRRHIAVQAESENGAETARHYDFDLFTIGAGSGGVRASRFASNFGASVAVCELPFSTISSETTGGVGGT